MKYIDTVSSAYTKDESADIQFYLSVGYCWLQETLRNCSSGESKRWTSLWFCWF